MVSGKLELNTEQVGVGMKEIDWEVNLGQENSSQEGVLIACCCFNKLPNIYWLQTTQISSLQSGAQFHWVPESRCGQGWFLLEALSRESVPLPFQLLALGLWTLLPVSASIIPSSLRPPFY